MLKPFRVSLAAVAPRATKPAKKSQGLFSASFYLPSRAV
jgi:hypothetical protein